LATSTVSMPITGLELRHRQRARAGDRIRAARAAGLHNLPLHDTAIGDVYVQHHPGVSDGPDAPSGHVTQLRREFPDFVLDIKRAVAEDDMVVTHSPLVRKSGDPDLAMVDIFRLENGKIAEPWDVIQEVPENSVNMV
jgi:predicted SnoaL-like aldol condensation-catalyzing enzyme